MRLYQEDWDFHYEALDRESWMTPWCKSPWMSHIHVSESFDAQELYSGPEWCIRGAMDRTHGFIPEMPLSEIGKEMGFSRERARQIQENGLRKLRKKMEELG